MATRNPKGPQPPWDLHIKHVKNGDKVGKLPTSTGEFARFLLAINSIYPLVNEHIASRLDRISQWTSTGFIHHGAINPGPIFHFTASYVIVYRKCIQRMIPNEQAKNNSKFLLKLSLLLMEEIRQTS